MTAEKIDLDIQTGEGCIERVHGMPNLSRLTSICSTLVTRLSLGRSQRPSISRRLGVGKAERDVGIMSGSNHTPHRYAIN